MSDKGKAEAIAILRAEVGFGCPVCRSPFLTWHHFDPPEHIEKHWRPEGIIALCPICHPSADGRGYGGNTYSPEELRRMKKSRRSAEDVKAHFPTWQDKESLLVRVGGCYTDTSAPIISVNAVPQIALGKNEAGLLSLSFDLRNKEDVPLLTMEENWLTAYPRHVHDMIVPPKTKSVKVWLAEDDVGLELSFKRITIAELDEWLRRDKEHADTIAEEAQLAWLDGVPSEQRAFFEETRREYHSRPRQLPPGAEGLPEELREAYLSGDNVGTFVKRLVRENCQMDDGLIPFLNFEQMAIYSHGCRITIKDGIAGFVHYCAAFKMGKGAINIPCPCPTCSPPTD